MTLTYAEGRQDFELAGMSPVDDPKNPERFFALCPVCTHELAGAARDDGSFAFSCAKGCAPERISHALHFRREALGTLDTAPTADRRPR